MIALPHALPFIRIGTSNLALCQAEWLAETLARAAAGTDLPEWMARDISRGVEEFLSRHYRGTVIDSEELFARIERTLASLGLDQVAANIDKTPPPVRISLSELARRAGTGYELAFFRLLDEQLRSAEEAGAKRVECHGLLRCVRQLAAARRWTPRCDELRSEIVSFIERMRERCAQRHPNIDLLIAP